jgi:hypothetical protein
MSIALLVASLVGVLAIVIKLTAQSQRSWLERDLCVGDLRTLSNIAFHAGFALPASTQIERLRKRGFLALTARGTYRMTLTGWVAVLLRKASAHRAGGDSAPV